MKKLLLAFAFVLLAAIPMAGQELIYPPDYVPPACTGIFNDVACPSQYANWIEQLYNEGITAGCGNGNYCPDAPTLRRQEAVFVLKAEHSILERFATGKFTCGGGNGPNWAICATTVFHPRLRSDSVVMVTYNTRASDTQIPARVFDVQNGSFKVEIQTNTTASYLAYVPEAVALQE